MFDPVAQRPLRLIQRPLIAMECSVIAPCYLGLGYGPASLALFCSTVSSSSARPWAASSPCCGTTATSPPRRIGSCTGRCWWGEEAENYPRTR